MNILRQSMLLMFREASCQVVCLSIGRMTSSNSISILREWFTYHATSVWTIWIKPLRVKFGEEYSEDDDLVTVAENEGILDVAWFIYEFIDLNIPIKHVHAPGKCNPAMIEKLNEHSAARSGEEEEETVDPRWEALLKLKK